MNYRRTNYVTFKNYWQSDVKENFFVNYAIRGPITIYNDNDFENQNLKMCGI
jgi:hypothetical protein